MNKGKMNVAGTEPRQKGCPNVMMHAASPTPLVTGPHLPARLVDGEASTPTLLAGRRPLWEGFVLVRGRDAQAVRWARRYAVVDASAFRLLKRPGDAETVASLALATVACTFGAAGPDGGAAVTVVGFGRAPLTLAAESDHAALADVLRTLVERSRGLHAERWGDRTDTPPSARDRDRRERSEQRFSRALEAHALSLDATVVHEADARVDDDDAPPPPPPTGTSLEAFDALAAALSDGDSSAPASPASPQPCSPPAPATPPPRRPAALVPTPPSGRNALRSAIHGSHGRRFRLLPQRSPAPDDDDDDDDDLISIEDAYMGGYLDARQYQARLARVDEDPMAAFFKAPP